MEKLPSEYHIRVTGEEQAMQFLRTLIDTNNSVIGRKITIIRFELREPSLHEIFVEKVGGNTVAEEEGANNEKE